jgi:diacylglycerol kinase (ATP)
VVPEQKKVLFIVNKFAGGGYRPELEGQIIKSCETHHVEPEILYTMGPGHATELASAAANAGYDRVAAVGGDGTINEVGCGLIHTGIPMGIIPRGSGNGLARHLCIPLSIQGSVKTFLTGTVTTMDVFTLNGKLSLNVSGVGFDGHIANLFGGKTRRGLTGYAKLTIEEFLRFPEFEARLTIDGKVLTRKGFVFAIANSSQYGNNACIAPKASVSDGLLHLNILRKVPPYRFDFVWAFFSKTIDESSYSEIVSLKELTIETKAPVPYHVDGEPCGLDNVFNISIMPSTLQIVAPPTA